jgi:CubicO group peptidase (beta-lactamase class C family)
MKYTTRLTLSILIALLILSVTSISAQDDPGRVTDEMLTEFTAYVEDSLIRWHIPGAAVAIVQDGKIVYAQGFGVRELGKDDPVTPDTVFVMGSMTKSVTDLMLASLVDDGIIDWDTRVVDIWPDFQLADPNVTSSVTVRDLLSMRAGLREDDSLWQGQGLSAEELLVAMAQDPLVGQPGEAFFYDNMGIAAAAYLGVLAAGGEYGNLFNGYAELMQSRVFDPIGMTSATVDLDLEMLRAKTHANLGWPHLWNETGELVPAIVFMEGSVAQEGIIPAGGMMASANDVARYLITQLNGGLSPDGNRVVSTEALAETRTPQISIGAEQFIDRVLFPSSFVLPDDAQVDYGMGWFVGSYHGVEVLTDPGDERGYTNIMALLPEISTGIVIFTNGENLPCARPMTLAVQYRFVELLYGMDNQINDYLDTILSMVGIECPAPAVQ